MGPTMFPRAPGRQANEGGTTVNVTVLGSNGQLGRAFQDLIPDATFLSRRDADLARAPYQWLGVVARTVPDLVINCAAYNDVDGAETDPGTAHAVNGRAVRELSAWCEARNVRFVSYTSDYVYGPGTGRPLTTSDPVAPLSAYGRSKAYGEAVTGRTTTIIRTSWLFGQGGNFVTAMLRLGAASPDRTVKVVDDQVARPTYAPDLAVATLALLRNPWCPDVANISNSGPVVSWCGFAAEIFRLTMPEVRAIPITTREYVAMRAGHTVAPRPAFSAFDLSELDRFGLTMPSWQDSLATFLRGLARVG